MDTIRIGRSFRALRLRRGWSQERLGDAVGVSRQTVSRVEHGDVGGVRVDTFIKLARALEASADVVIRWHGESLDRLRDARHADLVERTVALLREAGWETAVEVTYILRGERGSIDILARHRAAPVGLVVEVKSVVPDMQAMLAGIDRKARLGATVAESRGWGRPSIVGRLLVLPAGRTVERRLAEYRSTLGTSLPMRGAAVKAWLRAPGAGPFAGILVLPDSCQSGVRRRQGCVRAPRSRSHTAIRPPGVKAVRELAEGAGGGRSERPPSARLV